MNLLESIGGRLCPRVAMLVATLGSLGALVITSLVGPLVGPLVGSLVGSLEGSL